MTGFKKIGGEAMVCLGLSLLALGTGCTQTPQQSSDASQEKPKIQIDGSSTVYPITNEVALKYQFENPKAPEIQVDFSGTGGGFRNFCAGETDINDASRPINEAEQAACQEAGVEYMELPIAYDAITVVVHPDNDWADSITTTQLKQIWQPNPQFTQWNQIRSEWPEETINLYGPGSDSGTFDYFSKNIVGEAGISRTDYEDSEDDVVLVEGVAQDPNALGYFGYFYYLENTARLKALAIDNGEGPVFPSPATVKNGQYQPLSRPLFLYVNVASLDEKPELQAFLDYYLTHGRQLVSTVGYIPLTHEKYNQVHAQIQSRKSAPESSHIDPELPKTEAVMAGKTSR
jgi:phosphate transport system substrate-binding protein